MMMWCNQGEERERAFLEKMEADEVEILRCATRTAIFPPRTQISITPL